MPRQCAQHAAGRWHHSGAARRGPRRAPTLPSSFSWSPPRGRRTISTANKKNHRGGGSGVRAEGERGGEGSGSAIKSAFSVRISTCPRARLGASPECCFALFLRGSLVTLYSRLTCIYCLLADMMSRCLARHVGRRQGQAQPRLHHGCPACFREALKKRHVMWCHVIPRHMYLGRLIKLTSRELDGRAGQG